MPRLQSSAAGTALALLAVVACDSRRSAGVSDAAQRVEWPSYGGDPGAQRYSTLETITAANVSALRPAWFWRTGERWRASTEMGDATMPFRFEATPVMLGDTLYFSTPYNRAIALDANTGRKIWDFDPGAVHAGPIGGNEYGFVHRGVAVWTPGDRRSEVGGRGVPTGRRVFLNSRARLFALDAGNGRPIASFGDSGSIDLTRDLRWKVDPLHYGNTSPPVVWRDLVIVGSSVHDRIIYERDPPGDVQAFDAITGARAWKWESIPRTGEPGSETWENGSNERTGHANVWAPFSVDTARGLIYLPVSTPSNDWYGGRRKGSGLYGESLVCIDARTGKRVWHYQLVHHGLWDYDPPSAPMLMTLTVDGRQIDAVALAGKTGFVYVFDRVTGIPVWPIEERAVAASDVPGEVASPTQPFPTRPAPFVRQGISDSDLVDFTPALRDSARAVVRAYRLGPLFTPPSLQGTVVSPGWLGGAGWGGGAFDPVTNTLYVKGSNRPSVARLIPSRGADSAGYIVDTLVSPTHLVSVRLAQRKGIFRRVEYTDMPAVRPPYGTLTAIDLNSGEHRWQVTLGDMPAVRNHPALRALKLPPLGVIGVPGPLVTRSGLLFISGGGDVLYALDARTGATLWNWDLGRAGYSNPMTYRTAEGRQFVVIAAGADDDARLIAFALPRGTTENR
jgi:quinoprotein glucose dehydrogenase